MIFLFSDGAFLALATAFFCFSDGVFFALATAIFCFSDGDFFALAAAIFFYHFPSRIATFLKKRRSFFEKKAECFF